MRVAPDDPERHLPEVDGVRALQPHPHRGAPGVRRIQRVEERAERQAGRSVRSDRGQRRIGRREERVLLLLSRSAGPARLPAEVVDPGLLQVDAETIGPRSQLGVPRHDPFGAHLGDLVVVQPNRPDPAAHAFAGLDHRHVPPGVGQGPRRREPREARPNHDDHPNRIHKGEGCTSRRPSGDLAPCGARVVLTVPA